MAYAIKEEKLSTNQKLALIFNGPDDDDDNGEKDREKAHARLRRSTLYGGGARSKIPKVRAVAKEDKSPFSVLEPSLSGPLKTQLESTVPPGAHFDQFRMVTNPTMRSLQDPDRTFINSTSMKEGILLVPGGQPAWYYGNNNKTKPPDSNFATMAASRYGFRGSKGIRQRHTEPYERPSNTRTEYTPSFLVAQEDVADEWVPPIQAATYNTINGYESPKLWPENTEYASGYMHKRLPSSYKYKRETTVDNVERPRTSQSLVNIFDRTAEKSLLLDYAKMEQSKSFMSLTMASQATFEDNWKQRVEKDANNTLRVTMAREVPPYEAHTLMDATVVMRYSGNK